MKNTPILGIDDGPFNLYDQTTTKVPVFGVIMKGSKTIEGIIQTKINKDDPNPTDTIANMIEDSDHFSHIQAVFHEGITIGGFGIIDVKRMYQDLNIPVILIVRRKPDMLSITTAIKENFEDYEDRIKILEKTGFPKYVEELDVFIHYEGIKETSAVELIKRSLHTSKIPEAVRIAHMIGQSYYKLQYNSL